MSIRDRADDTVDVHARLPQAAAWLRTYLESVDPAVPGGASEVLDLGRSRRLFSPAQCTALALRHTTCVTEGCTISARWCEAHHAGRPWSRGGRTDLAEATLFCSRHHLAHDPGVRHAAAPDGGYRFHRRTQTEP